MMRSPFSRNFLNATPDDLVRGLSVYFRQVRNRENPPLPPLSALDWRKWGTIQKNAYAEALIWKGALHGKIVCPEELWTMRPFGEDTPCLKDLLASPCAISQFPTRTKHSAFVWHLYLFRKPEGANWRDHRKYLTKTDILAGNTALFLMNAFHPPKMKMEGDSWQLACNMAYRILPEESRGAFQQKLLDWLITGALRKEKVSGVTLEGKTSLCTDFPCGILAPEENRNDAAEPETKCTFVSDTDMAWRIITGSGFEKKTILLPEEIDQLHILVGEAVQPVISVILLLNPHKVFLWGSQNTAGVGERIRLFFATHGKSLAIECECRFMDSHDLQQSYADLDRGIRLENTCRKVISNTGGNRLMGIAALLVAQTRRIPVVYRDFNALRDTLTIIQFEQDRRYSADLTLNRCPIKEKINWEWLYSKGSPPNSADLDKLLFHA